MSNYTLQFTTTEGHVTTKVYTEESPQDTNNPYTVIKTYSRGQLTRVVHYDDNGEVINDWQPSSRKSYKMFTDRLTDVRRVPKNIPTAMLLTLVD